MITLTATLARSSQHIRRFYSSHHTLWPVQSITGPLNQIDVEEFRAKAFLPQTPLLIKGPEVSSRNNVKPAPHVFPAADKWFIRQPLSNVYPVSDTNERVVLSQEYLATFGETILPYELITPPNSAKVTNSADNVKLDHLLDQFLQYSDGSTFHQFSAPLSLFLLACATPTPPSLYIAQAQLRSLPPALQLDLPTPHLVRQAGKGDIYDANLWMGIPPTYTPLHKDPNPNLFVQLASKKRVRLFGPNVGAAIFREVREGIGRGGLGGTFRGHEMMEGPEREGLLEAVWGNGVKMEKGEKGFETTVGPEDALFIPKGWWHSFMSVGEDVTGSVNWWFR